jgi:hypothetical protein
MNSEPVFVITIDTEGDNLWGRPAEISTDNAYYLPRFQAQCERFGFKPTYLANYEMAMSEALVEFGRDVIARGAAEIGMHLHAWNSPPIVPLTDDDYRHHPYLIEYPDSVMRDKVAFMTELLEDRFGVKMVSHRAGRWGFDERYARLLIEFGYRVDCSVTPGVSWRANAGAPLGQGGSDYRGFPEDPYFIDPMDISASGNSPLLEVPVTTVRSGLGRCLPWLYRVPLVRGWVTRITPEVGWLQPNGSNREQMLRLVHRMVGEGKSHLEFMLHSSEFMPGGSPWFSTQSDIDRIFADMEALFETIAQTHIGLTLAEFRNRFPTAEGNIAEEGRVS